MGQVVHLLNELLVVIVKLLELGVLRCDETLGLLQAEYVGGWICQPSESFGDFRFVFRLVF